MTRKIFSFLVVFLGLLGTQAALAELSIPGTQGESQKPELSGAMAVAMTYYRFSAQSPDFNAWALLTDEYKNAKEYEKAMVQDRMGKRLAQDFGLIAVGDQLVVDVPVTLSDYSLESKGYLIDSFTADMYFPFTYSGETFAVVPDNMLDRQWIEADGFPAKAIDDLRHLSKNGKDAVMTLFLVPKFASKETVDIGGVQTRVIAADVGGMSFFDPDGRLVWHETPPRPGAAADDDEKKKELLQLYK